MSKSRKSQGVAAGIDPHRRGRRTPMSEAEKVAKAESRTVAASQKKAAAQVLAENPQFTNHKFWKNVDVAVAEQVTKAISKANAAARKVQLKKLEAEAAKLRSEIAES